MAARLKHSKRRSNPTPTSRRPPTRRALATQHEPRRADHNGDTEGRILDAAHAVFVRHGTAGARMQDIAKEAGVNQALLHYYFRTKDRLAEAVFRRTAGQLFPQVIQVMASDASLEEKIVKVVSIEIDHLSRTSALPGYIISELHHHPERARQLIAALTGATPEDVRPRVLLKLRQQIDAGVRTGRLRPIAPEQFLVNLLSLCVFPFAARPMLMILLGLNPQQFDRFIEERRHQLADFFLRALGA
jgi:TetR/AcrR family transcriptional regulator